MFAVVISGILQAIPVLLVVGFLSFALFAYVGDPVSIMLGQDYTEAQRLALVHQLGLDRPFIVQYADFLWRSLHGNFALSYRLAQPVAGLIAERLPATLELSITASVLACAIGVPMGVYTGIYARSWLSRVFMVVSLVGVSLPTFLTGILLILVFSVALGWLPSFGRRPVTYLGMWWTTGFTSWAGIKALILPSITLGLFQMTLIMRLVRAEMLEVLRADYIRFARALSSEPEFLVCDEPTSALDVSVHAQILNLMKQLQTRLGLTFLFISHNLAVVRHMSDQLGVMYLGRIVECGPAEALFRTPRHPYTRLLLDAIPDLEHVGRSRTPVGGEVPSPIDPPPGCPFHPRCPLANARCRTERPMMHTRADGDVLVACHAVEEGRSTA